MSIYPMGINDMTPQKTLGYLLPLGIREELQKQAIPKTIA
jgi:hypothetical protein